MKDIAETASDAEILGSTIAHEMIERLFVSTNQQEALTALVDGLNKAFNPHNFSDVAPKINARAKGFAAIVVNVLERGRDAICADGPFFDNDEVSDTAITVFGNERTPKPRVFPRDHENVTGRILGALLRGEHMTYRDFRLRFGAHDPSSYIYKLQQEGWPIQSLNTIVSTSDDGHDEYGTVYWLNHKDIANTGDDGRAFAQLTRLVETSRMAT